jgi:hypothetical protein
MMRHERTACDEQLVIRMPATLRDRIEEKALQEGRSVASAARRLLEKATSDSLQKEEAA